MGLRSGANTTTSSYNASVAKKITTPRVNYYYFNANFHFYKKFVINRSRCHHAPIRRAISANTKVSLRHDKQTSLCVGMYIHDISICNENAKSNFKTKIPHKQYVPIYDIGLSWKSCWCSFSIIYFDVRSHSIINYPQMIVFDFRITILHEEVFAQNTKFVPYGRICVIPN
jgi:hypothetical protein